MPLKRSTENHLQRQSSILKYLFSHKTRRETKSHALALPLSFQNTSLSKLRKIMKFLVLPGTRSTIKWSGVSWNNSTLECNHLAFRLTEHCFHEESLHPLKASLENSVFSQLPTSRFWVETHTKRILQLEETSQSLSLYRWRLA